METPKNPSLVYYIPKMVVYSKISYGFAVSLDLKITPVSIDPLEF